jgi:hypothetical protein
MARRSNARQLESMKDVVNSTSAQLNTNREMMRYLIITEVQN